MAKMWHSIRKLIGVPGGTGMFVAAVSVLGMAFILAGNTISRYVFDSPWYFAEEYTGYLVVMLTFLPLAYTLRTKGHIAIDIVTNRLPEKTRARLEVVTTGLSLMVLIIMIWYALKLTIGSFQDNVLAPTVAMTPLWIPQMFVVVGLIIFVGELMFYMVAKIGELKSSCPGGGQNR